MRQYYSLRWKHRPTFSISLSLAVVHCCRNVPVQREKSSVSGFVPKKPKPKQKRKKKNQPLMGNLARDLKGCLAHKLSLLPGQITVEIWGLQKYRRPTLELVISSSNGINMPLSLRGNTASCTYCTGNQCSINHLSLILLFSSWVRNGLLCFTIRSYASSHLESWGKNRELVEWIDTNEHGGFSKYILLRYIFAGLQAKLLLFCKVYLLRC